MGYRNGDDLYNLCATCPSDAARPPGRNLGFASEDGERRAAGSGRIAGGTSSGAVASAQQPSTPPSVLGVPLEGLRSYLDERDDGTRASAVGLLDLIYGGQGARCDVDTGLYRFGARDYCPVLGRWMGQDPAGYVDGSNRYQAFNGRPAGNVDPIGLAPAPATAPDDAIGPSWPEQLAQLPAGIAPLVSELGDDNQTVRDGAQNQLEDALGQDGDLYDALQNMVAQGIDDPEVRNRVRQLVSIVRVQVSPNWIRVGGKAVLTITRYPEFAADDVVYIRWNPSIAKLQFPAIDPAVNPDQQTPWGVYEGSQWQQARFVRTQIATSKALKIQLVGLRCGATNLTVMFSSDRGDHYRMKSASLYVGPFPVEPDAQNGEVA